MAYLCHRSIHIYNVCLALLCSVAPSSSLVDVVGHFLAFLIRHGVGEEHVAAYLHRSVVFRYDDAVALAQYEVRVPVP